VAELRREQDRDLMAFGVKFDATISKLALPDGRSTRRWPGWSRRARLMSRRRVVAAHDGLWRRQGPRNAQIRRRYTYFVPDAPIT
jgi:hypothetical protein